MEITCSTNDNAGFICLIGQLWQKEDLTAVEDAVEKFLTNNIMNIVIDVDRLSFINSAGLGMIARLYSHINESGGKLILFNPHSSVLEVIEISGFDMFMTIVNTQEELKPLLH